MDILMIVFMIFIMAHLSHLHIILRRSFLHWLYFFLLQGSDWRQCRRLVHPPTTEYEGQCQCWNDESNWRHKRRGLLCRRSHRQRSESSRLEFIHLLLDERMRESYQWHPHRSEVLFEFIEEVSCDEQSYDDGFDSRFVAIWSHELESYTETSFGIYRWCKCH